MVQAKLDSLPAELSFEAYRVWQPPDDRQYELFGGRLIPMNPPTPLHVNISQFLVYQFQRYFAERGIELVAKSEAGVRTEQASSRIPDVVVCTRHLWEKICSRPGSGILDFTQEELPRLVVEVISTNWQDDYLWKRAEYAVICIPEYWIVDYHRQQVWVLTNPARPDGYDVAKYAPGDQVESAEFEGFSLMVDDLLNPPLVEELMRQVQLKQNAMAAKLRDLGVDPESL
ncbi:MAG: Uma2 family endonuclease [Leptolyngbyaceae cyanobacterium SM2_5_2]|nr:Uma2 family endonuclease [Leptolyngbyaceae cyanobacterium SM2_5_2]